MLIDITFIKKIAIFFCLHFIQKFNTEDNSISLNLIHHNTNISQHNSTIRSVLFEAYNFSFSKIRFWPLRLTHKLDRKLLHAIEIRWKIKYTQKSYFTYEYVWLIISKKFVLLPKKKEVFVAYLNYFKLINY